MNNCQLRSKTLRTTSGLVAFQVELLEGEEVICQKTMSVDDYITLLEKKAKRIERPTSVRVGELPDGFVDGYKSTEPGTLGAVIRVPSHKHQFVLAQVGEEPRSSFFIPLPNLIYAITYNSGNRTVFSVYCYKEWKGEDTELYMYPFGNVSANGSICMGTISTSSELTNSFLGLREVIEYSLCGITNSDYLSKNNVRLNCSLSQHQFCRDLQESGSEEFPHDLLLSQGGNKTTVRDLLKDTIVF